jgi:hypothetical protein
LQLDDYAAPIRHDFVVAARGVGIRLAQSGNHILARKVVAPCMGVGMGTARIRKK